MPYTAWKDWAIYFRTRAMYNDPDQGSSCSLQRCEEGFQVVSKKRIRTLLRLYTISEICSSGKCIINISNSKREYAFWHMILHR